METSFIPINEDEDYINLIEESSESVSHSDYTFPLYFENLTSLEPFEKIDIGRTKSVGKNILIPSIEYLNKNYSRKKFRVLQKWEGVVEKIENEHLEVSLIDLTNSGTHEEGLLYFDDIPIDDKALVKKGAMFYWNIGYETQKDGQIRKTSFIKFKRLPKIDSSYFDAIFDRSKEIEKNIRFD